MEREVGDDEVEGVVAEGQMLLVHHERQRCRPGRVGVLARHLGCR